MTKLDLMDAGEFLMFQFQFSLQLGLKIWIFYFFQERMP
jgi:hypothetical protein